MRVGNNRKMSKGNLNYLKIMKKNLNRRYPSCSLTKPMNNPSKLYRSPLKAKIDLKTYDDPGSSRQLLVHRPWAIPLALCLQFLLLRLIIIIILINVHLPSRRFLDFWGG